MFYEPFGKATICEELMYYDSNTENVTESGFSHGTLILFMSHMKC